MAPTSGYFDTGVRVRLGVFAIFTNIGGWGYGPPVWFLWEGSRSSSPLPPWPQEGALAFGDLIFG